ncbi:MAG: ankyrin repeat domain-containing protein [Neisseriaceae bacterium]|nr:ankyrin repeat domain-containing protein [Neisseriaceae bacterium]
MSVNATSFDKWTALMLAALHGQTETVRCLLGHRTKGHRAKRQAANPYATLKNSSMNAFLFAVRSGNADTVRLLLDKASIDINHRSEYELRDDDRYTIMPTPLMLAARYGHRDVMKLLIEKGADVSIIDNGGEKALSLATKHGHIACVRLLFELGLANANSADHWETPILTIASRNGHKDLVQFLLDNGAEVNRLGGFWGYETAIKDAVFGNHIEIVQLLLDAGADVNLGDKIGNLKSNNAYPVLVLYMVCDTYGEKINMDMLKLLLDAGANVNAMDNLHETALYKAAENGDIDAVRLLLDYGADVNLGRETPLIAALSEDSKNMHAIVQLLIDNGADVHRCTDKSLWSTVMLAAVNHPECLQFLIDAGADINYVCRDTTDYRQYTALLWAAEEGITESVKILLANGADIHAKNKRGRTALDLAMTNQHTEIVQLLQAAGAKNSEDYSPQTAQAEKKKSEEEQMLEVFQSAFGAIAENKDEITKIYQKLFVDMDKE